jgi:hypothetical protein
MRGRWWLQHSTSCFEDGFRPEREHTQRLLYGRAACPTVAPGRTSISSDAIWAMRLDNLAHWRLQEEIHLNPEMYLARTSLLHESERHCGQLRAQRVAHVEPLFAQSSIFRMGSSNEHASAVRPTNILTTPYELHDFARSAQSVSDEYTII